MTYRPPVHSFRTLPDAEARMIEAIDEAIQIGKEAGIPVHIYHLKAAGRDNWPLMSAAIERIREARANGFQVTADIYPYTRNGIGLDAFVAHPQPAGLGRAGGVGGEALAERRFVDDPHHGVDGG